METPPVFAGVKPSATDLSNSKEGRTDSSEQANFNETFENTSPDNNEKPVVENVDEPVQDGSDTERPKTEVIELSGTIAEVMPTSAEELLNAGYKAEQPTPKVQLQLEVSNVGDQVSDSPITPKDDPARPQVNAHSVIGQTLSKDGQIEGSKYRLESNSNIEPSAKQIINSGAKPEGIDQQEQQTHNKSGMRESVLERGASVANTPTTNDREDLLKPTTRNIKTNAESVTEQSAPQMLKDRSETATGALDLPKAKYDGETEGVKQPNNVASSTNIYSSIRTTASVETNQLAAFSEANQPSNPTELEVSSHRVESVNERITSSFADRPNVSGLNSLTFQNQRLVPASIVEQLNLAVSKRTNGSLEIQLDPVELGKVRLQISPSELGQRIIVMAERPEVLDLLRKNEDLLAFEFAEQGLENSNLQFEHHNTDRNDGDVSTEAKPMEPELWFEQANSGAGSDLGRLSGEATLDIRL